jgi:uncharacterized membrane protein
MSVNVSASPLPQGHGAVVERVARVASIDIMRGLVMMVMMLDHVRERFFLRWPVNDPMDIAAIDPALFFGRFAAHFCAPIFVFLTGLSAWLYAHPASGPRPATGFLLKRGLFLVLLEIFVINVSWSGQFPPQVFYLQVIWAIGLSMIALALLHRLPRGWVAALGLIIVCGHNLLSPIAFEPGSRGFIPWTILHDRGFLIAEGAFKIKVSYPLLPWIGVILLGYAAGPWYAKSVQPVRRRATLLIAGGVSLAMLLVLRGLNIYGETLDWVPGETALLSVMSFLNVTKYPPSLAYLLITLGGACLVLAWLEGRDNGFLRGFLRVSASFGGAPMFYYLLHLFVLLFLQLAAVALFGANHGGRYEFDSIWMVWLLTVAMIPLMYWPCKQFGQFKRRTTMAWVKYF